MGLVICGIALLGALALTAPLLTRLPSKVRFGALALVLIAIVVIAIEMIPGHRVVRQSLISDPRFKFWPTTIRMIWTFFPLGAGIGAFDNVYPRFERLGDLMPEYVNRAHNDFLEIGAEAGIVAYALLAIFLAWWITATVRVWRTPVGTVHDVGLARTCSLIVGIGLIASATDYPLRTSLIACIFAAACVLLYRVAQDARMKSRPPRAPHSSERSMPASAVSV
jgi:O-antigen ligase